MLILLLVLWLLIHSLKVWVGLLQEIFYPPPFDLFYIPLESQVDITVTPHPRLFVTVSMVILCLYQWVIQKCVGLSLFGLMRCERGTWIRKAVASVAAVIQLMINRLWAFQMKALLFAVGQKCRHFGSWKTLSP